MLDVCEFEGLHQHPGSGCCPSSAAPLECRQAEPGLWVPRGRASAVPVEPWPCSALARDSSRPGSGSRGISSHPAAWGTAGELGHPSGPGLDVWVVFGNWEQDRWLLWVCVRSSSRGVCVRRDGGRGDGEGEGGWCRGKEPHVR